MTANDQNPPNPRIKWGRILLAVSLAFNLLIIGMFVGARLSGGGPGGPPRDAITSGTGMGFYGRALSREDRKAVFAGLRARKDETRQTRQTMRDLGGEIVKTLTADPYDAAKLSELLTQQRAAAGSLLTIGQEVLEAHIATMPAAERASFANRISEGLKRRGKPPRN